MCGIAGFKTNKPVDHSVLKSMVKELYHRGPDAEGYFSSHGYQAGMRRLTINDLKTGNQPLYNMDRSVVLLYNGEIYNSPQLREDLEKKGYRFRSTSDGEVICHLYDEYKEDLFSHLDGMFAAALWIEPEQKLILARDIPGEKPLYFSRLSDTEVVFSSEIKSLKHFKGMDFNLNYQAIWDMPTFLWIPEPQTVYQTIQALMPGEMLIADSSGIKLKKYTNTFNQGAIDLNDKAVIAETRRVVEQAVNSRLLSDVPVGCFLSSGLDSSIVTTIASKHISNLSTFTIGFENISDPYHGHADESLVAQAYSKRLGTRHHTIRVTADTFLNLLDDFCLYGDQPFSVSSGLGLLAIARAAREAGVKVLLSGDGADEIFGGYSWYEHLPAVRDEVNMPASLNDDTSSQNYTMKLDERLNRLGQYNAHKRAWAWHYYASEKEKSGLFSDQLKEQVQSSLRYFNQYNPAEIWKSEDYVRQDRMFYLPNEMLRKVDRMTMAYSVEGRAPFVAPSVLAHADKLKYSHLVKDGSLKWVLRQAFRDILPSDIIDRPKHGFNVPIDHWLKGEWSFLVDETFSNDSKLSKLGIIHKDSAALAKRMVNDQDRLNGHSIFSFIMLNLWLERNV